MSINLDIIEAKKSVHDAFEKFENNTISLEELIEETGLDKKDIVEKLVRIHVIKFDSGILDYPCLNELKNDILDEYYTACDEEGVAY